MEYIVNLSFPVFAIDEKAAKDTALNQLSNMDFIQDNVEVAANNDEIIILAEYVKISKYREKVVEALKHADVNGLIPKQISQKTGILQNHISIVLKQLADKELVVCINPEARKGRIYRLTDMGFMVGGLI